MLSSISIVSSEDYDDAADRENCPPTTLPPPGLTISPEARESRKPSFLEADGTVVPLLPRTPTAGSGSAQRQASHPPLRPTAHVNDTPASRAGVLPVDGLYVYRPQVERQAKAASTEAYHALQLTELVAEEDSLQYAPSDSSDDEDSQLVVCPLKVLSSCSLGRHTRKDITQPHTLHEHIVAVARNTQELRSDNAVLQQQYSILHRKYKAQNSALKKLRDEVEQLRQFIIQLPSNSNPDNNPAKTDEPAGTMQKHLPRDISNENIEFNDSPEESDRKKKSGSSGYAKRLRQRTSSAAQLYELKKEGRESLSPPVKVLSENIQTPKLIGQGYPSSQCPSLVEDISGPCCFSSFQNESAISVISSVSFEDVGVDREGDPELEAMRQLIRSPSADEKAKQLEELNSGRSVPSISNTHVPSQLVCAPTRPSPPPNHEQPTPRHHKKRSGSRKGDNPSQVQLQRQPIVRKEEGAESEQPKRALGELDVNQSNNNSLVGGKNRQSYSVLGGHPPKERLRNVASQAILKKKNADQ
ncbi:hypothetical protein AGDE_13637 [Angomonas deanei]|uniref:Uncharacterized protein n=1 Tax=Angomonas deanei TaxID=59799 RepID=A0A7G2C827_9TRYP|nr:hypothetical protein AGDE_13637 [Angomonas deanei]CAD2215254.1 hypothetical protein, conserved [Angomonas deanei]|eukprot:EPY22037.1 hypothetical protein AGDE_13637 [Angomonas deanei]